MTTLVVADWIKRIADDERKRDAARLSLDEAAARRAELVRSDGRRLVDQLHAAVARDAEAFRAEFAGDGTREVTVEAIGRDGGFVVRKPAPAAVSLTVEPNLAGPAMICHYRFTLPGGLPPREDRVEMVFAGGGGDVLRMKNNGTGQAFPTADDLSEYLLAPVFTGRPR